MIACGDVGSRHMVVLGDDGVLIDVLTGRDFLSRWAIFFPFGVIALAIGTMFAFG